MKTKHWLIGCLVLFSCNLYSTYSKDNDQDCTSNVLLCPSDQACNLATAQCEPRDMAVVPPDLADPPPDLMPPPPPPTGFMFSPQPTLGVTAMQISGLTAGDLNRDGYPEIVITDAMANNVVLVKNLAGTGFDTGTAKGVGMSPAAPRIADLDNNSLFDVANVNTNGNSITVQYGDGNGNLMNKVDVGVSAAPLDLAIGDVLGDGRPALITANPSAGNISVVRNNGSLSLYGTYSAGNNPSTIALGQFDLTNGTGPDVVVANRGNNQDTILLNNGLLLFGILSMHVVGTGATAFSALAADFDGDGQTDIASVVAAAGEVRVCFNNSSSGCKSTAALTAQANPAFAVAADFTGDGKVDLAVTNRGTKTVSVFANENGKFSSAITVSTGSVTPYYIAAADFEQDGKIDIVIADQATSIIVLRNTSN